jgi:putative ABC transport system permease protein
MTYLRLARRNFWRRPFRTLMLVVCVAVAFLIYGLTASFVAGSQGAAGASDDILAVMNKSGSGQSLPIAFQNRLSGIEGIAAFGYVTRLRGYHQVERNVVAVTAADPATLIETSGRDLGITPELLASLTASRDQILVGRAMAQAQGWTVGQAVTVTAFETPRANGSANWSFRIAGIFDGVGPSTDTYFAIAQYDYVNAERARDKDTVSGFVVRPDMTVAPAALAARIDEVFANSSSPTKTQSEKQFLQAFLRQFADVGLIVNLVVSAAFVTILMIVANSLLFAMRERTYEIGLLKTLGFPNAPIITMVLSESVLIFLVGGVLGVFLAKIATVVLGPALGLVMTVPVIVKAGLIIVALGLLTGLLPATMAMRTTISKTLRAR